MCQVEIIVKRVFNLSECRVSHVGDSGMCRDIITKVEVECVCCLGSSSGKLVRGAGGFRCRSSAGLSRAGRQTPARAVPISLCAPAGVLLFGSRSGNYHKIMFCVATRRGQLSV